MSLNVLIVDDDNLTRRTVVKALKKSGLQLSTVHEAANGLEGLKILNEQNIDFALLDLHMPKMDGLQLVQKIRSNPDTEKLPVVIISGDTETSRVQPATQMTAGFIQKPFSFERLGEMVMDMISARG